MPKTMNRSPSSGLAKPDSLQSNGSQYGERRCLVADVVRDFGRQVARRPDELGVATVADHSVSGPDAGDVRPYIQNDAGVAVTERHGFVELAEHGFQSRRETVRANLVEHLFDFVGLGSCLLNEDCPCRTRSASVRSLLR